MGSLLQIILIVEEVLQFENFDLEKVVTPVKADVLESLLRVSGYDIEKSRFLVDRFRNGFSLGYKGKRKNIKRLAPNLKVRVGKEVILWNKVMKEVKAGRYTGLFVDPPFEDFIQSLIGLVPKDSNDTRLIFHLSYPRSGDSVNSGTPPELCKVKYCEFDDAIRRCLEEGKGCKILRLDMKSAFRNLGLVREFWPFLLMKVRNLVDKKWYFFVDKCLPFGASISCAHFQAFSNAIAHIVRYFTKRECVNYLDDYLFAALIKAICDGQVRTFLDIYSQINFPISLEKTF